MRVLDHHNRCVDHRADRDRDPPERHDVRGLTHGVHRRERHQERERQREDSDEGAPKVEEKKDTHETDDDRLLDQLLLERLDRLLDERRPVVDGNDLDSLRQSLRDLLDLRLHALDDLERVFAEADDDDTAHGLAETVELGGAPPHVGSELDPGDVPQQDGCALLIDPQNDLFEVFWFADIPPTAHHVFGSVELEDASANVVVRHLDGLHDVVERDPIGQKLVRLDLDLILLHVAPERSDVGHAGHSPQPVADGPVLQGSQLLEVQPVRAVDHGVLVRPAYAGGVRAEDGSDSRGKLAGQSVHVLEDAAARPVDVRAVLEDDVDKRHPEVGVPAHDFDLGS